MATYTGKDGVVYFGSAQVAEVCDWSIEETAATVDSTVMGDDWVTKKVTQKSWTASVNIYYDSELSGHVIGKDDVALKLYPEGITSGGIIFEGTAIITSRSTSASFDGMIEESLSLEGTGSLTQQTVQ